MNKSLRWDTILKTINIQKKVNVNSLSEKLSVSPSTIRRDLTLMEEQGIIKRYYGGAKIIDEAIIEPPMIVKSNSQLSSKKKIALLAASIIKDNQMIFLDAGSSTYEMVDYISAKNITVVTTGIPHISKLIKKGIHTIVLGGTVKKSTEGIVGKKVIEELSKMKFDISFIGVNGIHEKIGLTCTDELESEAKQKAIANSDISYGLVDITKFNKLYPEKFANLKDIILLSDVIPDFNKKIIKYILINGKTNI